MSRVDLARRIDALAQFRVVDPENPWLADADAHHLFRVLRASEGEEIVVTNGAGSWSFARVNVGSIERTSEVVLDEQDVPVTLYLAPLKGDRSEWAIAKATELGVTRVVPLISERTAVRWRAAAEVKVLTRWRRIASETAGQCRRTYDLTVEEPVTLAETPLDVAVADFEGTGSLDGVSAIAIGPEGGWSPGEWSGDRVRIGLGTTVLRAETAAVAAATLLVAARDGWSRRSD